MKQGQFITTIAKALAVDAGTVRLMVRRLREEDLLTHGAHGVNAPDMTPRDAARMIIALLATEKPVLAVERLQEFGQLRQPDGDIGYGRGGGFTLEDLAPAAPLATFEDALAALVTIYTEARDDWRFQRACVKRRLVEVAKPPCVVELSTVAHSANIFMGEAEPRRRQYSFSTPSGSLRDATARDSESTFLGKQGIFSVNQESLWVIADGFRQGVS